MTHVRPRRLISIGRSYAVVLARRLAHEMARAGEGRWEITAVAPKLLHGDLRPIPFEPYPGPGPEPCQLEVVPHPFAARSTSCSTAGGSGPCCARAAGTSCMSGRSRTSWPADSSPWWAPRDAAYVFWTSQNLVKTLPAAVLEHRALLPRPLLGLAGVR